MKGKKIAMIAATAVASLMVTLSGVMKLVRSEQVVTKLTLAGVGPYITLLGMMEIGFTAIFLFPKTMKLGFILLTCYFAGAIATDLSHGTTILNAAMPLALVWIAAFLRDKTIFLPSPKVAIN